MNYGEWQIKVDSLIFKRQKRRPGGYKKSRWRSGGTVFISMYKEGLSPENAAFLWGLNHIKRK